MEANRWTKRKPCAGARDLRCAVAAVLVAALAVGSLGCRGKEQRISPATPMVAPARDLDYTVSALDADARGWASLSAPCEVIIRSPQINVPARQARLGDGRIIIEKPGKVNITMSNRDQMVLRLVGDGERYRVEMPVFSDAYSGSYGGPATPQPRRIHFMPEDVAAAFDPRSLLADSAQAITQWEQYTGLYNLQFVETPRKHVRIVSSLIVDRRTNQLFSAERYNEDGSVRVRISYSRIETLMDSAGNPVAVPTQVRLDYPAEQTAVLVGLRNIELNKKPGPEVFALRPATPPAN